jgi:catechol 2,3-dioxygenase-like lactoylglutathione lyase family enzyme
MENPACRPSHAKTVVAFVLSLGCMMATAGPVLAASDGPIETGLDHVAFEVADIDKSIKFYTEYLGFQQSRRADYSMGGVPADLADADLTAAFVHRGSTSLELIQFRKPRGDANTGQPLRPPVFHLGIYVGDVREAYKQLTARGLKLSEPRMRAGSYTASLQDPDGVTLELMEVHSADPAK